jgi:dTDP-3,4-didehydro-2,6-dideoxy-alpha-D-glucose 3-reductase
MLRLGLIACSSVAQRRFLPALKNSRVARLENIGSRDLKKAEQFAREHGAKKSGTYEDVLRDPEVDAVYISTPLALHGEWVRRAADSGKHIICEKPVCPTLAEARELEKICREKKVRLLEGYAFAFHPQHALAKKIIAENKIGTPRFFSGEFTFPRPSPNNIRLKPELNGGVFFDALGYPIAAALMMFGRAPASVSCELSLDRISGVDGAASARLNFSGGETAHCFAGFDLHYRSRYAVAGSRGRFELERAYAVPPEMKTALNLETETGVEKISLEPADQFALMIEGFSANIAGTSFQNFEAEWLQRARVIDAAARSARERRTVEIENL